jgi:hypothetical protein
MIQILSRPRGKRGRRLRAGALGGISALTLATGLAWTAAPAAHAATVSYEVAYHDSAGDLALVGTGGTGDSPIGNLAIMPGTSPAIAYRQFTDGTPDGYIIAYQDTAGQLIEVATDDGPDATPFAPGVEMAAGTSPSITALDGDDIEVAVQDSENDLITVGVGDGSAGMTNWGLMAAGTSPSVTALPSRGVFAFEVAYQGVFGLLTTVGAEDHGAWDLGMAGGTSPSITQLPNGGYEAAFQANTGNLWTAQSGASGGTNLSQGMMAGTSPSITVQSGGYEIAFQANTGNLITFGTTTDKNWELGMRAGTSPAITSLPSGGNQYEVAFQANTGQVWTVGQDDHDAWNSDNTTAAGTSPSIGG